MHKKNHANVLEVLPHVLNALESLLLLNLSKFNKLHTQITNKVNQRRSLTLKQSGQKPEPPTTEL